MPIEIKSKNDASFIAEQLLIHIGERSYRQISKDTGYNPETVRRFFKAESRINAHFLTQVCLAYRVDGNMLLTGKAAPANLKDLRALHTADMLGELTRRLVRIEDCAVGHSIQRGVDKKTFLDELE